MKPQQVAQVMYIITLKHTSDYHHKGRTWWTSPPTMPAQLFDLPDEIVSKIVDDVCFNSQNDKHLRIEFDFFKAFRQGFPAILAFGFKETKQPN